MNIHKYRVTPVTTQPVPVPHTCIVCGGTPIKMAWFDTRATTAFYGLCRAHADADPSAIKRKLAPLARAVQT